MDRKPMNIFLHFLNKDTQEIYGIDDDWDEYTYACLKKGINASILLCDVETYCFLPLGFWFESQYTRRLLLRLKEYIKEGYIRFSARERTIREFIEKKRAQYAQFRHIEKAWGIYQGFFSEEVFQQLAELHPILVDRTTKIGERCSVLWKDEHTRLISNNQGDLLEVYSSVKDFSDRERLAKGILTAAEDAENPFVWGKVSDKISGFAIRDKSIEKGLRIYFEKNYYNVYLKEYMATNLYNFYLIDKGIDFHFGRLRNSIADYRWFETFLTYLGIQNILNAPARKIVKLKQAPYWSSLFQTYINICNALETANFMFNSVCAKMIREADIELELNKVKKILEMEEQYIMADVKGKDTRDMTEKPRIDVLIMIATVEEEKYIVNNSQWEKKKLPEGYEYFIHSEKLNFALARAIDMGMESGASAAQYYTSKLEPRFLAMAGFCAGKKGTVNLGDIIVPDKVYRYDGGKQLSETEALPEIDAFRIEYLWKQRVERFEEQWWDSIQITRPITYEKQLYEFLDKMVNNDYVADISELIQNEQLPNINKIIAEHKDKGWLKLEKRKVIATDIGQEYYAEEYYLKYPQPYCEPKLKVRIGALATGNKVQQYDGIFQMLEKSYDRKTYALDMEGYAIADIAKFNRIPYIIAKGVGDYAGSGKGFENRYIEYAVFASYRFLVEFFNKLDGAELLGK